MHGNLAIKNTCKCNGHSLPPHQVEQFGDDGGHLKTTIKYWELNHEEIVWRMYLSILATLILAEFLQFKLGCF